jgi:sulfur-oxidizing protein SoxY
MLRKGLQVFAQASQVSSQAGHFEMKTDFSSIVVTRRGVLGGAGLVLAATSHPVFAATDDDRTEDDEVVERLTGRRATESPHVQLRMPPVFGNGYSVPLSLSVDSPMTEDHHVRTVHIIAPKNPIIVVAILRFTPDSGRVAVSTRIRLAEPQTILAVAEMSDGALLMARTHVKVDTDGCA